MDNLSRREIIKVGLIAAATCAAIPLTELLKAMPKPAMTKRLASDVHFHGKQMYAEIIARAKRDNWHMLPMGELMGQIGLSFLETPYVNYTLDHSADHEFCIVNLQELDCVTFVETVLGLARVIKLGENEEAALASQIDLIRYRNGDRSGFCSRLHYLSDWLYDNQRKNLIYNYTESVHGAQRYIKKVSLMSARPKSYLQLRAHPLLVSAIRGYEAAINKRVEFYIPKADVRQAEIFMETGDIIAITTAAKILDCAHTGLCYRDAKGVLRFLHASLTHHKVYLDQELAEYLDTVHAFTGIMVAPQRDPKQDDTKAVPVPSQNI